MRPLRRDARNKIEERRIRARRWLRPGFGDPSCSLFPIPFADRLPGDVPPGSAARHETDAIYAVRCAALGLLFA